MLARPKPVPSALRQPLHDHRSMNTPASMSKEGAIHIVQADYTVPAHASAVIQMLDAYARDPMGGAQGLSDYALGHVVQELARRPFAFSVLAFDAAANDLPVGLVNCIEGFSTFACKPIVNVHDLAVREGYRGQQIGQRMLQMVEHLAQQRGACKLTLEVLSGNHRAMRLYERVGFAAYQLDPTVGQALFLQKWLN